MESAERYFWRLDPRPFTSQLHLHSVFGVHEQKAKPVDLEKASGDSGGCSHESYCLVQNVETNSLIDTKGSGILQWDSQKMKGAKPTAFV